MHITIIVQILIDIAFMSSANPAVHMLSNLVGFKTIHSNSAFYHPPIQRQRVAPLFHWWWVIARRMLHPFQFVVRLISQVHFDEYTQCRWNSHLRRLHDHLFLVRKNNNHDDFETIRRCTHKIVKEVRHEKHPLIVIWTVSKEWRLSPRDYLAQERVDVQVDFTRDIQAFVVTRDNFAIRDHASSC